jgi:hypothetical protein
MESPRTALWWTRRRDIVKHSLARCLMTRAKGLFLGWHPAEAVEHRRQQGFSAGCHRVCPLGGCGDMMASSMAWDGARRLGEAQSSSAARDDDAVSSSTALAVFSGSASSSTGWRRLFLLGVVKCRRDTCLTTQCGRARFFVASFALGFPLRLVRLGGACPLSRPVLVPLRWPIGAPRPLGKEPSAEW